MVHIYMVHTIPGTFMVIFMVLTINNKVTSWLDKGSARRRGRGGETSRETGGTKGKRSNRGPTGGPDGN